MTLADLKREENLQRGIAQKLAREQQKIDERYYYIHSGKVKKPVVKPPKRKCVRRPPGDTVPERKQKLDTLKSEPCMDCGNSYPPFAMDFDHILERGPKVFAISRADNYTWQNVLDEIAKCDLVCATCHRIRTYNRLTGN